MATNRNADISLTLDAEMSVIGGLITIGETNNTVNKVFNLLSPNDFFDARNKLLFESIKELAIKNKAFDIITLSDLLMATNNLIKAGGPEQISKIASMPCSPSNIFGYAKITKQRSIARQAQVLASDPLKRENIDGLAKLCEQKDILESDMAGHGKCLFSELSNTFEYVAQQEYGPVKWLIDDILPTGVTMLLAKPKQGKSWLALEIALAVALGLTNALGCKRAHKGDVLYFALEDNQRRMNTRIKKLIYSRFENAPKNAHLITTKVPRLSQGFEVELEYYLNEHPNTRLVVVDPFTFIETPTPKGQHMRSYSQDYEAINKLTNLTRDKYTNLSILLVYHMRKEGSGNWLDTVMGTTGLSGAVDNLMFLRRENAQADAVFYISGKDIAQETEYALKFDKQAAIWEIVGQAQEYALSKERAEIVECLKQGEFTHYRQIADYIGKKHKSCWQILNNMVADGQVISIGKGHYKLPDEFQIEE